MSLRSLLAAAALAGAAAAPAAAHHSFAIYDMSQNIEFEGVVETVKLRNPHMALTLVRTKPDGTKETINFVEGAPAPRRDDSSAYFLKKIILPDGREFSVIN
jgi:hypothetical protein